MKFTFILLIIMLLALGANTLGQDKKVAPPQHSHPEYEKKIGEMLEAAKQADHTYQTAEETYQVTKEFDRIMVARESIFFILMSFLFSILAGLGIWNFISTRSSKKKLEEQAQKEITEATNEIVKKSHEELEKFKKELHKDHAEKIEKIIAGYEETFSKMLTSKEAAYRIRNESKICVINQEGTNIPKSFYKVLGLFKHFDKMEVSNFSDVLLVVNLEKLKGFDLVIIENLALPGIWIIDRNSSNEEQIKDELSKLSTTYKTDNYNELNQAIIIRLANEICSNTGLIYYGGGNILSNLIDELNQPMFSFAQAPSTLYSNMMNLLKFKNVINRA